jgi:nitrite reductase/ring-hydroxylating ferredoxin subunit
MFTPLARLTDLFDGYKKVVQLAGKPYVLLQAQGELYLVENRCPHLDAPLDTGEIQGAVLRCRAHGIAFDLTTGNAQGPMAGVLPCLQMPALVYEGDLVGVDWA